MAEELNSDQGLSGIVGRAKAILIEPIAEWPRIAGEPSSVREVLLNYALPLAAIGPVAGFIGGQLFGYGAFGFNFRVGIGPALGALASGYILAIISLFVLSAITNVLAPRFGGTADSTRAFKLVAYSMTAAWIAGVFALVPGIAFLGILGLYSIYLFYAGAGAMMNVPQDKATAFTAVTFVAAILLYLVVGAVAANFR